MYSLMIEREREKKKENWQQVLSIVKE